MTLKDAVARGILLLFGGLAIFSLLWLMVRALFYSPMRDRRLAASSSSVSPAAGTAEKPEAPERVVWGLAFFLTFLGGLRLGFGSGYGFEGLAQAIVFGLLFFVPRLLKASLRHWVGAALVALLLSGGARMVDLWLTPAAQEWVGYLYMVGNVLLLSVLTAEPKAPWLDYWGTRLLLGALLAAAGWALLDWPAAVWAMAGAILAPLIRQVWMRTKDQTLRG